MMNRAPAAQEISIHVLENGPFDPSTMCIHELFEARAQAAPDAVAATSGGDAITYGELNRRANRLAHRLIEAGVTQGAPVGVFVERSLAILVALLGILKAGGAYLPLDAKLPRERLERMLADSGTKVLLTERARAEELSFNGDVISPEESAGAAEQNPTRRGTPGSPAYVMFTSGSTGRPKGVVIPHGAVVGLVVRTNYVDIRPSDRVAHVSNLAFDASTFEIWGALLNGARVIILPNEVLLSPGALAAAVRREGVTVMFITAAFFHQLASVDATAFAGLKYLLVGGDACDPRWVREVLAGSAPGALLNAYGPTESTTFATFHRVIDVPPDATTVPIGRPVSGTTTHVLGPDLRPVSRGAAGELYLGGDRLAVGYLNQPEITAQKFIADPFSSAPGARLYRTGDWVRELPDGTLVFIGRTDNQIKIRGHRIELGEIEAALRQHPSVAVTVVTVREDVPGDKRITAYIVPPRGRAPAIADLRRALRESLPAIMVPSAFVVLERLPATPNGKVDIAALPPPSRDSGEAGDMVEPRSATEARLARAYAEILGLQEVGAEDDFFGLGGSSLAVVRLLARIRKEFNVELPSRC
ncbi:MAG TPA: non-ribosomal peptide synthetase, partial [Polyangiaceae bacterium]|nr:non-ribosomal peptide synthetase [Polyangiaceae bacterium]